jgi:hypothetical protein
MQMQAAFRQPFVLLGGIWAGRPVLPLICGQGCRGGSLRAFAEDNVNVLAALNRLAPLLRALKLLRLAGLQCPALGHDARRRRSFQRYLGGRSSTTGRWGHRRNTRRPQAPRRAS